MKKRIISGLLAIVFMMSLPLMALADGAAVISGDNIECRSGETVTCTVSIKNNPGITAFLIGVYSESDWISFSEEAEQGEFSTEGTITTSSEPQHLNAAWFNADAAEGDGILFSFDVTVSVSAPSGEYPIQILVSPENTIDADCEEIEYETVDGCITVVHEEVVNTNEDIEDDSRAAGWWIALAAIALFAVIFIAVKRIYKKNK